MNKNRIAALIRSDIIIMNGGKNRFKTIIILIFLFCSVLGFIGSPLFGVIYGPVFIGCLFVPMLFANEQKYHSAKMYSTIPIGRKDLVLSRFILTFGLYSIVNLTLYLLMILSLKIAIFKLLTDGIDPLDFILKAINSLSGGGFTKFGIINLMFWCSFSFGLIISAGTLRKGFRNPKVLLNISLERGKTFKEFTKQDRITTAVVVAFVVLFFLTISGIIPVAPVGSLISAIIMRVAPVMNGFMLSSVLLICALFSVAYSYTCAVIEYEDREI